MLPPPIGNCPLQMSMGQPLHSIPCSNPNVSSLYSGAMNEMDLKNDKSKDMTTSGSNYIYQTVFCQHNNFINLPFIEIRQNCQ
jgi:hypothetical protein